MGLVVNVGLNRKASRNYQSAGVSIALTAELDQALLARPEELQRQVAELYAQAETALARQAPEKALPRPYDPPRDERRLANGHRVTITEPQRRAIEGIAQRHGTDPRAEAHDLFGVTLEALTVRQASELIDYLRRLETPDEELPADERH